MASWMVHLRIADSLLNKIRGLDETAFVMGNIAPDSGVPNADWTTYTPSSEISHFKKKVFRDGKKENEIEIALFVEKYLSREKIQEYDKKQYSFYVGYWTHLYTDILWAKQIAAPCMDTYIEKNQMPQYAYLNKEEKQRIIWGVKADWYDLDFLYIQENPNFRAFHIYKDAVDFENTYMDIFAKDAFENRRKYITGFYMEKRENLDREYPYLTKERAQQFVVEATEIIQISELFQDIIKN